MHRHFVNIDNRLVAKPYLALTGKLRGYQGLPPQVLLTAIVLQQIY